MTDDRDDRLATAAILAHGVLNSLTLVRVAVGVLEESSDRSGWSRSTAELMDSVDAHIEMAVENLRLIARGSDPDLSDMLDKVNNKVVDVPAKATDIELDRRLDDLLTRRLDRMLTQEEQANYDTLVTERRKRRLHRTAS